MLKSNHFWHLKQCLLAGSTLKHFMSLQTSSWNSFQVFFFRMKCVFFHRILLKRRWQREGEKLRFEWVSVLKLAFSVCWKSSIFDSKHIRILPYYLFTFHLILFYRLWFNIAFCNIYCGKWKTFSLWIQRIGVNWSEQKKRKTQR